MSAPLVEVEEVKVTFQVQGGTVNAIDGVTLQVMPGETFAVVGESGCGKTTLARAILGLQPISAGSIKLLGQPVEGTRRNIAKDAGMVWQDPYASLDPRWTVGRSAMEPLKICGEEGNVSELFDEVGLDDRFIDRYPHQLSGGQRQRVAIARALAPKPPLVLCDEPTAALDLSIRAQILNLLKKLQAERGCSFLYISHDLGTVRFLADRVAVMYMGRIVETGPAEKVFHSPKHPYTQALLDSAPTLERLMHLPEPLAGEIPDPRTRFQGCRFAGRCPSAQEKCNAVDPGPATDDGRTYFCHFPLETAPITASRA